MAKKININNVTNDMFWDSSIRSQISFIQYFDRLCEIAMTVFKWENLPATVDERFLELTLLLNGNAIFFKDDVMGYLGLECMIGGPLNVYRIPINRTAYAANGYQNNELTIDNSVIIYDNYIHNNKCMDLARYANDLYTLDQIIMINAKAQRTPIMIIADDKQRLTLKNLYNKYEGNQPFIFGTDALSSQPLQAINTGAPFIANDLYDLRVKVWEEALVFLGVSASVTANKKERQIRDEVRQNNAGSFVSRFSRLEARRQACNQINRMFPELEVDVDYREVDEDNLFDIPDVPTSIENAERNEKEGEDNE